MATVEKLKVINVDGTPLAVDELSEQVKQLVAFYDEWRQDESDEKIQLIKTQSAMKEISREIILTIRAEAEESEKAAVKAEEEKTESGVPVDAEIVDAPIVDPSSETEDA